MSAAQKTVLIVDDQPDFRTLIRQIVEACGYVVTGEADNGRDAVRLADELRPDVITMDLEMPQLNGAAATAAIRSTGNTTPIVIVTGSQSNNLLGTAIAAGAQCHVAKHDVAEQLPKVLQSLLETSLRTGHEGTAETGGCGATRPTPSE